MLEEKKHVSFNEIKQRMEEQNKKSKQEEQAMTLEAWKARNESTIADEVEKEQIECVEIDQSDETEELKANISSLNNEVASLKEEKQRYIMQIDWYEDIINSFNKLVNKLQ